MRHSRRELQVVKGGFAPGDKMPNSPEIRSPSFCACSLGQIPHLHRTGFLRGSLDLELKVSTLIGNGDQDRFPGAPKALPPIWVFAPTRSWNVPAERSQWRFACRMQESGAKAVFGTLEGVSRISENLARPPKTESRRGTRRLVGVPSHSAKDPRRSR